MQHGIFERRPREAVRRELVASVRASMDALDDAALADLLEDALYSERKRTERLELDDDEARRLDNLARALMRGDRRSLLASADALIDGWVDEIHGHFSQRAYRFATRVLPRGLTALLSAKPPHLRDWDLSNDKRLRVSGDLELIRQLSEEATLLLAPTHVSNLDSPLIGLALHKAGLPPFVYGAGLNLFSNPVMGWWLGRLGAYTVDRTKRARLYKDTLKAYSVWCLSTRHHSLFFPGGTRARSGEIERKVKKGLLGTGIVAWQDMLAAGRTDREVYVVPLTLSFQLVLEASTLIDDHLADAGKQRYIIVDDESAQPRRLASFARRVLDLDASVVAHFGAPVDVLGNPVSADPGERAQQAEWRRGYVTDRDGAVQRDPQRDHIYTNRLADALVRAWPRGATVMVTHLAAHAVWHELAHALGTRDPFRLVRTTAAERELPRAAVLERLDRLLGLVRAGATEGRWACDVEGDAPAALEAAAKRFASYHRTRALEVRGDRVLVPDPRLALYYSNRLTFAGLEG
jgi:glycerol-3-phosphate O-acyltransferase